MFLGAMRRFGLRHCNRLLAAAGALSPRRVRSSAIGWAASLLAGGMLAAPDGRAQPYPSKPIRMIVPVTPGGSTDTTARIVTQKMSERLGQPIIIDNRPGAGSIIGTDLVAKAPADGYTLLMAFATHITMPHLNRKLPFDPVADFQPVSLLATQPLIIIVNAQTPVKTVKELIAFSKANPGKLHFGLPSSGSAAHIAGEMFKLVTGANLTAVPYKGAAPAQQALAGNEVQLMFANLQTGISMAKMGRVTVIAAASSRRLPQFPDVPTLGEQGIPDFEVEPWQGILGPARTPAAIVDVLHRAAVDAVRAPDVAEKLVATGSAAIGSSPQELGARIRTQLESWGNVIRKAGIAGS